MGLLALVLALCWPDGEMGSRDIGCARVAPGRSQEICRALAESMEWTWFGHAIVSPGWRVTWDGLAHVWCAVHITDADIPLLDTLRHGSADWRLESGAEDLIHLLKSRNSAGAEDDGSLFDPKNPSWILKGGCAGR